MIDDVSASGVIFTRDTNSGAPYFVINYDDETGRTDTVTDGSGEFSNRTLRVLRSDRGKVKSKRFRKILDAVNILENYIKSEYLDIEFAYTKSEKVFVLQVRPMVVNKSMYEWDDAITINTVEAAKEKYVKLSSNNHFIFGQMPDWNPAEIIGQTPSRLSYSLYKKLITRDIWY